MGVRIIVDSSANTIDAVEKRLTLIPLTIRFGETEYTDRVTITHREFYEKLIENDEIPTTSQASPVAFEKVFAETVAAGDTAVVITISSKLSGTLQSAAIAAEDHKGKIFIVDSKSVSIGAGILAELALRLKDEGKTAEEIAGILTEERENIRVIAMLDTLEYLKKGGRISAATAFAGGILSIKPVVCIQDGEVKMLGKARGSKQGNNLLVQEIQSSGGVDFSKPLLLGYTGLTDALLQKYIQDSAHLWENNTQHLHTTIVGSVVGTHVGPGAVAAAFFKNK